jgi:hypothetical protein
MYLTEHTLDTNANIYAYKIYYQPLYHAPSHHSIQVGDIQLRDIKCVKETKKMKLFR